MTTGALFQAIEALNPGRTLSKSGILLYGAYGSAVIFLVYLPAHRALRHFAVKLCEKVLPMPDSLEEVADWHERRTKLETFLRANESPVDAMKNGVAILIPLASSAAVLFLGKG